MSGGCSWRTQGTENPHPTLFKVPSSKSWKVSVLPPLLSVIPSPPPYSEVRAARAAGSIFLPKASRTGPEPCKLQDADTLRNTLPKGNFVLCSLSAKLYFHPKIHVLISSKIPLKEIGRLQACFRCGSRWLHFA